MDSGIKTDGFYIKRHLLVSNEDLFAFYILRFALKELGQHEASRRQKHIYYRASKRSAVRPSRSYRYVSYAEMRSFLIRNVLPSSCEEWPFEKLLRKKKLLAPETIKQLESHQGITNFMRHLVTDGDEDEEDEQIMEVDKNSLLKKTFMQWLVKRLNMLRSKYGKDKTCKKTSECVIHYFPHCRGYWFVYGDLEETPENDEDESSDEDESIHEEDDGDTEDDEQDNDKKRKERSSGSDEPPKQQQKKPRSIKKEPSPPATSSADPSSSSSPPLPQSRQQQNFISDERESQIRFECKMSAYVKANYAKLARLEVKMDFIIAALQKLEEQNKSPEEKTEDGVPPQPQPQPTTVTEPPQHPEEEPDTTMQISFDIVEEEQPPLVQHASSEEEEEDIGLNIADDFHISEEDMDVSLFGGNGAL